jgi:hypothetical protein
MTRAARTPRPDDHPPALSDRISWANRKVLAYVGAGLVLATTGAAVTASLGGGSASAADRSDLHRAAAGISRHAPSPPEPTVPGTRARTKGIVARQTPMTPPTTHPTTTAEHAETWTAVSKIVAKQTDPGAVGHGPLPAKDRLTPAGTSGPQTWLPITHGRYDNAKAIIGQVLAKHMGVRAAVVAVATSMQESGLENLGYGTSDSLGLFQQRPSMGWGTAAQIMHPAFAADAFLGALRGYEARNPGWAHEPLWQPAQAVQASGYPYAYARWEAQAAHLVAVITPQLV